MAKYVIYAITDARDGYYVTDYRLTDSDDLRIWNEYALQMKDFEPSTKSVYILVNTTDVHEQFKSLFVRGRNHQEDRVVFKMTCEAEAIARRLF